MKASIHRPTRAYVDVEAIAYNVQQIQAHIPERDLDLCSCQGKCIRPWS